MQYSYDVTAESKAKTGESPADRGMTFSEIAETINSRSSLCHASLFYTVPSDFFFSDANPRPEWLDSTALEQLVLIENLTRFVERYDFPAWQCGLTGYQPSDLGSMCHMFMPIIGRVTSETFPSNAPEQTERVRVFIEACEEMRLAGYTCIGLDINEHASLSQYCNSHNELVVLIRKKLRRFQTR